MGKREPVSLVEMMAKREEEMTRLAKPVFMNREERMKEAMRQRELQVAQQKARLEENQRFVDQLISSRAAASASAASTSSSTTIKENNKKQTTTTSSKAAARRQEWDPADDTMKDALDMYNEIPVMRPLFGRGFIGGIDRREQLKLFNSNSTSSTSTTTPTKRTEASVFKHWSEKKVEEMTERDWRIFKEDHSIVSKGANIPHPIRNWAESHIPPVILDTLTKDLGYEKPTPIQMAAIPIGMQFRDLVGVSETGSGKTAAFVIPILVYVSLLPPMTAEMEAEGPYALIMGPTRELVLQIDKELRSVAVRTKVRSVALIGGESMSEQAMQLRHGCEVIVATPARMRDVIDSRHVVLNQCNYVVLDEADRMITMGFEAQVNSVLETMPSTNLKSLDEKEAERQEKELAAVMQARMAAGTKAVADVNAKQVYRTTVMFTATLPPEIERMSRTFLRRPVQVTIGNAGRVVDTVSQLVLWMHTPEAKHKQLKQLLQDKQPPIMIFVNQKKAVDGLVKQLIKDGYNAVGLHSDRTQEQRERALEWFKAGKHDILVSTDVASRGIDVKGVTLVVNYDMPNTFDAFVHRVGRTGRAGMRGEAISFVCKEDTEIMYDLRQMLLETKHTIPPELNQHPAALSRLGDKTKHTIPPELNQHPAALSRLGDKSKKAINQ